MPKYHGDLMYKVGNVYTAADDRNYVAAVILALLFGVIGVHRFFLNDYPVGYAYFIPFSITALMGMAMLDFTLLLWYCGLASLFVLGEIVYFIYKFIDQHS
ncbi:MAG: NINE protein [Pseudomonadota bacterium]